MAGCSTGRSERISAKNKPLEEVGAVESLDYCLLPRTGEQKGRGGSNRVDYLLTLDTANEMAMLERNEMGKMVRRYFIEAETTRRRSCRRKQHKVGAT